MAQVRMKSLVHFHHTDIVPFSCECYVDPKHIPDIREIPGILRIEPYYRRETTCRFSMEWDPRYSWDDIQAAICELVLPSSPMPEAELPVDDRSEGGAA